MGSWQAETRVEADPELVLAVLTDPEACARWAPLPFEVEGVGGQRLEAGSRARVSGRLAGREVAFDVDIIEAGVDRLVLRACGPLKIDVSYEITGDDDYAVVAASLSTRGSGGLRAAMLSAAAEAVAPSLLDRALDRIRYEARQEALALAA
jgi:hypothetical protein